MKLRSYVFVVVLLVLTTAVATARPAVYRQGEVIVKYRKSAGMAAASAVSAAVPGATVRKSNEKIRTRLVKLPPGISVDAAIKRFKADPRVEYAGPNHILRLCLEPNDYWFYYYFYDEWFGVFEFYAQWGLYDAANPDAGIQAPDAWDITTGSPNVIIAIVDTGIMSSHEDISGKLVPGINCLDGANPSNTQDDHGHGTLVAGIAAANTDNYVGVAGVSWGSKLMPIKVMDANGMGTEQDAADGIVWAADHGAQVINLSLGTYDDVPALRDAVNYAWNRGCVVVAASGNNESSALFYPAAYERCIAVGATNESRQRCSPSDWGADEYGNPQGSNYGSYLDVVAPGNNIVGASTEYDWLLDGYYTFSAGTSAASPVVAGIAALVLSHNPTWTNAQVRDQIENTCVDIGESGWDQYTGWGLVNAYHALADPPPLPLKISELTNLDNGSKVRIEGAVLTSASEMLYDRFYAEQDNRVCGLCLLFDEPPADHSEGEIVTITGRLQTINGERTIKNPVLTSAGSRTPLEPVAMTTRAVGGSQFGYRPGITGGQGLNNVSLLVTVYGRVTAGGWTYFYIDDGCGLYDGSGFTGLRIVTDSITPPPSGSYVKVTGIVSVEQPPRTDITIPVVRVRKPEDIVRVL